MPFSETQSPDEARLETNFEELVEKLKAPSTLNPLHGAPVFYFVYPPRQVLTVRKLLPVWKARLAERDRLNLRIISLAEIVDRVIQASGRWETWLELEEDFEVSEMNRSVSSALEQDEALIRAVVEKVKADSDPGDIVFLTDVELLHPYARTRPIEHALHQQITSPVVFLYPGRRVGQYGLNFLEFYPEDSGYRSTIIGGLE